MNKNERTLAVIDAELKACHAAYEKILERSEAMIKEDVSLLNAKGRADFLKRHAKIREESATLAATLRTLTAEINAFTDSL